MSPPYENVEGRIIGIGETDSDDSEESLMSEDEIDQIKITAGSKGAFRIAQLGDSLPKSSHACILLQRIESCKECQSLSSLLQAHIDLDDLRESRQSQELWQGVWTFLKKYSNSEDDVLNDVRKDFRRRQVTFPQAIFTHSVVRLQARLDRLFLQEIDDQDQINIPPVRSPAYTSRLSQPERKSFNACLQIWRKTFRGNNELFSRSSTSRWATCVEISALCGRGRDELVYCASVGQNWPKEEREPYLVTNSWYDLMICCTSIIQWKRAIISLLPQLPSLRRCYIQSHDQKVVNARAIMSALPPCVYSNWEVRNTATLDSLSVCNILISQKPSIRRTRTISSLLGIAAMAVQRNQSSSIQINNLPAHLLYIAQHSYRCVSCRNIITPPSQLNEKMFSTNFQRAASSAGFNLTQIYESSLLSSIKLNSNWLPPFDETIGFLHDSLDGFSYNPFWLKARTEPKSDPRSTLKKRGWQWMKIGGYYSSQEKSNGENVKKERAENDEVEEELQWRFCLPCGASHLWIAGYGGNCRCSICLLEKQLLEGRKKTRWLRYVYSDTPPV
jgi:hypothetical protein